MNLQRNGIVTSEKIYHDLSDKIENLDYLPGDRLSENELCGIYGVSRHVIRNALAELRQRELVDIFPQRGTFVSLINMNHIASIQYIRESLEQEALYRISLIDDRTEIIHGMQRQQEKMRNLKKDDQYRKRFHQLDSQFHMILLEAVGQANVMEYIGDHYIHVRRWRNMEKQSKERFQGILKEHDAIIQAIEKGDWKAAREEMHEHLDTVNRYSKPWRQIDGEYFVPFKK